RRCAVGVSYSCIRCCSYLSGAHLALHSFPTRRSSDLVPAYRLALAVLVRRDVDLVGLLEGGLEAAHDLALARRHDVDGLEAGLEDRKSTRLNSSHVKISYAVFCLKKKKKTLQTTRSLD